MSWATLDGHITASVTLRVPQYGAWFADVVLLDEQDVTGRVELVLGDLVLSGTVDAAASGSRGAQSFVRLVAGGGAWGTLLNPKGYAADNGVKRSTVSADAAREAGEELEGVHPTETLGRAYVRTSGAASRVLEDALGHRMWWVDFDGVTQVGERATNTPAAESYIVLEERPDERVAILGVDDLRSVGIGSVLSDGLDEPLTVREMSVVVDETVRVTVWGGETTGAGRLEASMRAVFDAMSRDKLYGLWPYRVVRMSGERVELQATRRELGLPDILPVDQYPGLAGAHAELAGGAEVLVSFVAGDRREPVITHFAGRRGPGHVPTKLTLDAETQLNLGAAASDFPALAQLVLDRLNAIKAAFDTHTHPFVATGAASPTSAPSTPMTSPASVAASLVRVE